ncbi:unnamed protein product [Caenorhabditis angaria]|uniref:DUF4139 domain-containing protein n=1 Tax=Caenorhabditis angaria TaxID=860376 RepID=A0A9P1MZN8_9PELO|nr:unnamed protein product [Caenorhabditis angaria]
MPSQNSRLNFQADELKFRQIIVLNDRAQINKFVTCTLKPGFNELVLKNLPSCLIHDSLRVEGKGNAKIHDFNFKNELVLDEESELEHMEKIAELKNVMKQNASKLNELEDRKGILKRRLKSMNLIVAQIGPGIMKTQEREQTIEVNEVTFSNIDKFFDAYNQKAVALTDERRAIDIDIAKTKLTIQEARIEKNGHINCKNSNRLEKNVYITLEADAETLIELDLIYYVHSASWTPSYDIRVDIKNSKMNLSYFGKISQHTGEDWVDAPLVLSTAKPSVKGKIPDLGLLDVRLFEKRRCVQNISHRTASGVFDPFWTDYRPCAAAPPQELGVGEDSRSLDVVVASEVTQSALSTEFKILREATIPNSTDEHKVTIGIVNLNPQLVHQTVPSKNSSAFLTASAINTSDLAFLAGQASIYLDNAFIAKTYLKDVSPGERFDCSLGVDTGIRIEYKPAKKYHQQAGFINKQSTNVTEQTIVIKNTRANAPILITMKHHIPRSVDEKIKVNLITPTATPFNAGEESNNEVVLPSEGAKLNSLNNLEWTVKVAQNSSQTLLIKYTIDHPKDEKIEFQEKF